MCLAVPFHLHFGQNDRDLLHATVVTRGWNGYESAQKSGPTEEIFSRPSDRGANPRPFDHESAALPLSYLRSPLHLAAMTNEGPVRTEHDPHSLGKSQLSVAQVKV